MNISVNITITKEYKLLFQFDSKYKEEIEPCIEFNGNLITIGQKNENSIHFIQEWIENSEDYKMYSVQYQGKEYQLLAEVLFALVISEFKQRIEKEYIIENTMIEIPTNNKKSLQRIRISLNAIGLRGIELDENEVIEFDYSEQGEYLEEILEKKETIEKYQRMISRAKEINPLAQEKLNQIDLNNKNIIEEDNFEKELSKKFSIKERSSMKLCLLDNYCVFIASRFFNSLEDHINLTYVSKKYKLNMEKFHYNPISLNETSVQLFPNIETLHIYKVDDKYLEGGRIERYINWNRKVPNYKLEEAKEEKYNGKEIEFKKIIWTEYDKMIQYSKQNPKNEYYFDFKLTIPKGVNEIDDKCLQGCSCLKQLSIPISVKTIPKNCIWNCNNLTNITLPLNEFHIIFGNKIFNTPHFEEDILLSTSIKMINGKQVDRKLTSFTIPTTVTSLDENCFNNYNYYLKELTIPTTVKIIPKKCIEKCKILTNITFSLNESQMIIGNKIFNNHPHLKQYIYLPNSIKIINGNEVDGSKFEIPTTVTSLDWDDFDTYKMNLKELTITSTIKTLSKNCLEKCTNLTNITFPLNESQIIIGNKIFNIPHLEQVIYLPESIKIINRIEVGRLTSLEIPTIVTSINWKDFDRYNKSLKELIIPNNMTKLSDYSFSNCEELTEIKGLEYVKDIGKGCFMNCPKLNREQYPEVEKRVNEYLNEVVKEEHQKQLEEWTELKCSNILFDSNIDDWTEDTSVLNERIIRKKQIVFLIEDEDNEIFGYYLNTKVNEEYNDRQQTDSKTFEFNLQSRKNRLKQPMKFEIKNYFYSGIELCQKTNKFLIGLGDISLRKENKKNESYCSQSESYIDFHGIEKALCGKIYPKNFITKRIIVIQMK